MRAAKDPLACSGGGSACTAQLPLVGSRAGVPGQAGSQQGLLLYLTPFWGMGYTSSKRSPVGASQLLHTFLRSEAGSDRASSDPTRPVEGGRAAAWHD